MRQHQSAGLLYETFSSATKPRLYAFQYIYCKYCNNLNNNSRAETQFDLFCPLFFFLIGNLAKLVLCLRQRLKNSLFSSEMMQWKKANDHIV